MTCELSQLNSFKKKIKESFLSIVSWILINSDKTNLAQVTHHFGQWNAKESKVCSSASFICSLKNCLPKAGNK